MKIYWARLQNAVLGQRYFLYNALFKSKDIVMLRSRLKQPTTRSIAAYLIICMVPALSWANYLDTSEPTWKCRAVDATQKSWLATATYQRAATNIALEACKQRSDNPRSCRVTDESCESFENGTSTRPMWRCTALDQLAKAWRNNARSNRNDAAIAAKNKCTRHSAMPDTCYINLMTCNNLNELTE